MADRTRITKSSYICESFVIKTFDDTLREIFKDEVRELGLELGLPRNMINRHPFPGPGLAIRVMGDVNKPDLDLLRKADVILLDVLDRKSTRLNSSHITRSRMPSSA